MNIVTSDKENGAVVGGALAAHMDVDKVAFTGEGSTGRNHHDGRRQLEPRREP